MNRFQRIRTPLLTWLLLATSGGAIAAAARLTDYDNSGWVVAMASWAALDLIWGWSAPTRPTPSPDGSPAPWQARMNARLNAAAPYLLYCLPLASVPILGQPLLPPGRTHEIIGAAVAVVGLAIAIWARFVLAENWSGGAAVTDRRALVLRGPYALVRHPIYLGLIVGQVGLIVALGQVRGLIFAAGIAALLKKMIAEEAALRAAHPKAYVSYARRVKRLLPWVW